MLTRGVRALNETLALARGVVLAERVVDCIDLHNDWFLSVHRRVYIIELKLDDGALMHLVLGYLNFEEEFLERHLLEQQQEAHAICQAKEVNPKDGDDTHYFIDDGPCLLLKVVHLDEYVEDCVGDESDGIEEEEREDPVYKPSFLLREGLLAFEFSALSLLPHEE